MGQNQLSGTVTSSEILIDSAGLKFKISNRDKAVLKIENDGTLKIFDSQGLEQISISMKDGLSLGGSNKEEFTRIASCVDARLDYIAQKINVENKEEWKKLGKITEQSGE